MLGSLNEREPMVLSNLTAGTRKEGVMLRKLFEEQKKAERGIRSKIMKDLQKRNLEKLEKELLERAEAQFSKRPKLQHVFFAAYGNSSLGKGCKVLSVDREGNMRFEFRQGAYGAILSV